MASAHNILRHGELDEVRELVDKCFLKEGDIRAVLLNLIDHMQSIERSARRAAYTASCLANGIKPD